MDFAAVGAAQLFEEVVSLVLLKELVEAQILFLLLNDVLRAEIKLK